MYILDLFWIMMGFFYESAWALFQLPLDLCNALNWKTLYLFNAISMCLALRVSTFIKG